MIKHNISNVKYTIKHFFSTFFPTLISSPSTIFLSSPSAYFAISTQSTPTLTPNLPLTRTATRSTQWEDPRLIKLKKQAAAAISGPYSRDYKQKYENLRKHLAAKKPVSPESSLFTVDDCCRLVLVCLFLSNCKRKVLYLVKKIDALFSHCLFALFTVKG